MDDDRQLDLARRDLGTLLGVLGGALGLSALSGCANNPGPASEPTASSSEAITGGGLTNALTISQSGGIGAGATSVTVTPPLSSTVSGDLSRRMWLAIEPYSRNSDGSTNCEVVAVTSTSGSTLTFTPAAARSHPNGATVALLEEGVLTPQLFGAQASGATDGGVTDDTLAIQAALSAAQAVGALSVYIPPGTYNVSGNMGLAGAIGITVRGAGMDATIINDTRAQDSMGAPNPSPPFNATYPGYGLLSFTQNAAGTGCSAITVQDLTVSGVATTLDGSGTAAFGRKGVFFRNSANCSVFRVRATKCKDEAIYAEADANHDGSHWTVAFCRADNCSSNAFNLNTTSPQAGIIAFNQATNVWGSIVQAGGKSVIVIGNSGTLGNPSTAVKASPYVLDPGALLLCAYNRVEYSNTSTVSVGGFDIFGSAGNNPDGTVIIVGNVVKDVSSDYDDTQTRNGITYYPAAIHLLDMPGSCYILDNIVDGCGRMTNGVGNAISINAGYSAPVPAGARVRIEGNCIRNTSGLNINCGIHIGAEIPAGCVSIGDNYFDGVATPIVIASGTAAAIARPVHVVSSASDSLSVTDNMVLVTATGTPVTINLPDATLFYKGGKTYAIKNAASQTGSTKLVPSGSQTIDGQANWLLTGAYAHATIGTDGAVWYVLA